jgi:very-short-patch-repair endonuclease
VQSSTLARTLRRRMTRAEVRIWVRLRRRQVAGRYFRRQVPIGPYVVDFLCSSAKLIIEIDGAHHDLRRAHDSRRTDFLEARGYRVIRFANHEVFGDIDSVIASVHAHLRHPAGFWR